MEKYLNLKEKTTKKFISNLKTEREQLNEITEVLKKQPEYIFIYKDGLFYTSLLAGNKKYILENMHEHLIYDYENWTLSATKKYLETAGVLFTGKEIQKIVNNLKIK